MSGVKRKRSVLNVKQKLEILQQLDKGESASTDAEDVLNEGNTISHSAALQFVETLLDYMGQRGFDYGDITVKILLDDDVLHVLSTVIAVNKEFISRQLATVIKLHLSQSYSAEFRSFALTLNFYSPRVYEYVRSTFGLALPHHKTLSRWYQHIDAAPGFTKEAIYALALKIRNSPNPLFLLMIMDEMSIRQQAEFDGKEVQGPINLGFNESDDDSLPLAKEAFVSLLSA
ncbi:hypothetical protein AVEN_230749-1 [Araneus ventricosus]|uniref:Uncharacterized protein n=1 Tax=Araneus ventricosus TaxID=182803 RepID=A0A4Y2A219_ARAVE|nr:hypothetical protein AVEN_230749-1 [Araneus ventricosus]